MSENEQNSGLYVPPNYVPETAREAPIIFLAGPIQGTGDWQSEAIRMLHGERPEVVVASPRRAFVPDAYEYGVQVDWETYHLRRAADQGVIIFWLAREEEHHPSRAYAQTSRFELAEWKIHHEQKRAKVVIGIEDGFSGATYIRRRFSQDCPDVPILETLVETCERALAVLFS